MMRATVIAAASLAATATVATAGSVFTTTYNSSLAGAGSNLNGLVPGSSGISNANMVVATVDPGQGVYSGVQTGLKAHRRFLGDLPTSPAGSTYFAERGFSPTSGSNPTPSSNATWNFTFAIDLASGGLTIGDVQIDLYVDFDPSVGQSFTHVDVSSFINADPNAALINASSVFGGSENLAFSYWNSLFGQTFDPNAIGLYDIRLFVSDDSGLITRNDMTVQVVPLPPAAFAGLGLLGTLAGVRAIRRR